ncbi:DNA-binding LytR/AlgR family response regulator [Bacilli bacterium PM5-3]|nr:DNA-binding LytR/AlgR family response regulator [Bacilli bacterium PM5-3]MDH6603094.1 DNA-binding LytR/AlgR family response regulator [Bacilli bacterium PM5-9]
MKIRLDIDHAIETDEVVVRAKEFNDDVKQIYELLNSKQSNNNCLILYDDNKEYIINIKDILFFETELENVYAHTKDFAFQCKLRLYELEDRLPITFMRISKSTIINVSYVYSIEKKLSSTSLVQFDGCKKEVYVSRRYYKLLKEKLLERSRL